MADEVNAWPIYVLRLNPAGQTQSWSAMGPLIFSQPSVEGGVLNGFRPFYVRRATEKGETVETTVLYPLFYYRRYGDTYEWSVFKLINRVGVAGNATAQERREDPSAEKNFDVWPFYFSRKEPNAAEPQRSLLPIYGRLDNFYGYDRLSWVLFPLYARTEKKGVDTTYTPWPFIRTVRGAEQGFAFWPLYGHVERPGYDSRTYALWPFYWNNARFAGPDANPATAPAHEFGLLPFYTHTERPGFNDENYAWPFFGHTDRTTPYVYHESRYFWPFLVQGAGDNRLVQRWGPFYTHSEIKGTDSTWVLWPFWHRQRGSTGDIAETKTQFFYFFSWSQEQRSLSRPNAAPAVKHHTWPIVSTWDDGRGHRQFELLSPFEPLFADNQEMREAWSPIFAFLRYDEHAPGDDRASFLFGAITWSERRNQGLAEFHLGPLLGMRRRPGGTDWSLFGFDLNRSDRPPRLSGTGLRPAKTGQNYASASTALSP